MTYRCIFIILMLIVSICLPVTSAAVTVYDEFRLDFLFDDPSFVDLGEFCTVTMNGADGVLYIPGAPLLPVVTKTVDLPFGSTDIQVFVDVIPYHSATIAKSILPAPEPFIRGEAVDMVTYAPNPRIYGEKDVYPSTWVSHTLGAGLNDEGEHKTKLTMQVFPLRYTPNNQTIEYAKEISVTVQYTPPEESPFLESNVYDMVIIAPMRFSGALERLIHHKNAHGISTFLKPVHEIYHQYTGYDRPEQIKYFIKQAVESWGVKYVLLVGGLQSQIYANPKDDTNQGYSNWFIPVRYTNIKENDSTYDPGFISDLYYADLYDANGNFSTWDSNRDGVFGKWSNDPNPHEENMKPTLNSGFDHFKPPDTDELDLYPDVFLGRLPCRNTVEVHIMVNKIIAYERSSADPSWYNRIILCGGDPYNDVGTDIIEGEAICEEISNQLTGFTSIKMYGSNQHAVPRFTPLTHNILREINKGCGHLLFDGHATPTWWNTFWPYDFDKLITLGGLSIYSFPFLANGRKLPICVIGGCHSCQFNVSLIPSIQDTKNTMKMWTYGLPTPECFGWALTRNPKGGSIATLGCTGLGYEAGGEHGDIDGDGIKEPDCVEVLGGYLETQFYVSLQNDIDYLGNVWGSAISSYLDTHPGMLNQSSAKTIEQWVLLGDPSLRIGGY